MKLLLLISQCIIRVLFLIGSSKTMVSKPMDLSRLYIQEPEPAPHDPEQATWNLDPGTQEPEPGAQEPIKIQTKTAQRPIGMKQHYRDDQLWGIEN